MFKQYIEELLLKDSRRTALFFMAVAAVFFIDKLTLGPLAAVQLHDIFETDFPRYKPMGELLFKHGLYFWYPNWPGGAPAYAWHHSPLYVLNIVSQFLPLWAVYGGLLIALMAAAGYGMYRFLSGYLNVTGWVALVGGAYFALNMQLTSLFVLYTFSYAFPLYFAWSWDFHRGTKRGALILKLVILNLFVALSYPVLTLPYFFILEVLLIVFFQPEGQNTRIRRLIKASLVWFGYIMVCAPVLYGLYKYIPFSHRHYVYEAASIAGFLKSLYNGYVTTSLMTMTFIPLAGAIAIIDTSVRLRRSLMIIAVLIFLYALASSGANIILKGTFFEKMDLGHIRTVFPIVMTMTAFIAIDAVIKDRRLVKHFLIGAAGGALYMFYAVFFAKVIDTQAVQLLLVNAGSGVFIAVIVVTAENRVEFSLPKVLKHPAVVFLICSAAIAAVFYFGQRKITPVDLVSMAPVIIVSMWVVYWFGEKLSISDDKRRQTAMLIIAIGVILVFQVRFTRFFGEEHVPYLSIFPQIDVLESIKRENSSSPFRAASVDYTTIPNLQSQGFETPDGRGPLFNKYYREFFKIVINPQLSDPGFLPYFEGNWYNLFISNFTSTTLFYPYSFLNIRYVSARGVTSKQSDLFDMIYAWNSTEEYHGIIGNLIKLYGQPLTIVRFKGAFDRAYLVKTIKKLESDKAIYDTLVKTQGAELVNTVYFSDAEAPAAMPDGPDGIDDELFKTNQMSLERYGPDELSLKLSLATPAAVVVSNNYAPNWRAYVDGYETRVLRANLAFQSIVINKPGSHNVVIKYEDKPQRIMLIFIPIGMAIFNYFITTGWRLFFTRE